MIKSKIKDFWCFPWRQSKKAMIFNMSMVVITVIVLTTALIILSPRYLRDEPIGLKQFRLIKLFQETEEDLFYTEQSGKYAVYNSVFLLAESGGFLDQPKCGKFNDYPFWSSEQFDMDNCFPDYKNNFNKQVNSNMKGFFSHRKDLKKWVDKTNYEFGIKQHGNIMNIVGMAINDLTLPQVDKEEHLSKLTQQERDCLAKPLHISIFALGTYKECRICPNHPDCEEKYGETYCSFTYKNYIDENYCNIDSCNYSSYWKEDKCISKTTEYTIKPSFNMRVAYGLNIYDDLRYRASEWLDGCLGFENSTELKECVEDSLLTPITGDKEATLVSSDNRTFAFEFNQGAIFDPYYRGDVVYKFALYFPITPIAPTLPTPI
jgi:hypothetical protein